MRKRSQLGRRSTLDIHDRLCEALKLRTAERHLVLDAVMDAQVHGIRLAASVAADYDRHNSHDYLVSECILGKLNVLKRKPRKNPAAQAIDNAVRRLADKVESVEGTMRFLVNVYKMPTPDDRMWRLRPEDFDALKTAAASLRKKKRRHSGAARAVEFIDLLMRAQTEANSSCRGKRMRKV